jgi:hypothetical protein
VRVALGILLVTLAGLIWIWSGTNGSPDYVAVPGRGHAHTAVVLPAPAGLEPALWVGTHDGLYIKELEEGAVRGWRRMGAPFEGTDVMAVGAARTEGSSVYAAGHDIGVQRSDDGGAIWRQLMPGAPTRDVHALAVDPTDPDRI